ncbi:hypothetical protein A5693_01385 [Mycobacterium sp. E1319]|nr:hypothetical protein A5693_01385 [Mycobacterium sp. E1319]
MVGAGDDPAAAGGAIEPEALPPDALVLPAVRATAVPTTATVAAVAAATRAQVRFIRREVGGPPGAGAHGPGAN